MKEFENKVLGTIKKHNMLDYGDAVVIGLSGGADSCALLKALVEICKEYNLTVIAAHLNHGIRGEEAKRDMEFSSAFSKSLGIRCITKTVSVPDYANEKKISEETAGRNLRYEFFNCICQEYSCNKIAVAHNLNDRAETILLNMIRGVGSNGIEGIKPVNNNVIRPVIDCTREEIEAYCDQNDISYVTDSTNSKNIYSRNIVRNQVFKDMIKINSNAMGNIIRFSEILSSESNFIDLEAKKYLIDDKDNKRVCIRKNEFEKLHAALKRKILINAIYMLNKTTHNISYSQIDLACKSFSTGSQYTIGNEIHIYNTHDMVIVSVCELNIPDYCYEVSVPDNIYICETATQYKFEFAKKYKKEKDTIYISLDNIGSKPIYIRTKRDGDVFNPDGMSGSKKLKKFYIDSKISMHQKNLYPVIATDDEILSVFPLRVSEKHKVTQLTKKILRITKIGGTYENNKQ